MSFDPATAYAILADVQQGKSVRKSAPMHGIAESTFRLWCDENADLAAQYASARQAGFDAIADEAMAIADNTNEDANSRRVRVDTRKWFLSKLAPKKYGDAMTLRGDAENPLHVMSDAQLAQRAVDAAAKLGVTIDPLQLTKDGAK